MSKRLPKLLGMSLLEILITVTILTILCLFSVYSYQEYKTKVLFSNSINILEQNKAIIYSYFSKYKECPPTDTIIKSLNPNNHIGDSIKNQSCNLILSQNNVVVISLIATIVDSTSLDLNNELSEGIKYQCRFNANFNQNFNMATYLPSYCQSS